MPSEGGQPRQLTFYQGSAQPLSDRMGIHNEVITWYPDSKRILFISRANATNGWVKRQYSISIDGGLPQPPQGKEYQLWVIDPKQPPRPEKTFSTDSAGKALLKVERLFEVEREYGVFAVTLEPAGGVQSPTGAMYLRSDL